MSDAQEEPDGKPMELSEESDLLVSMQIFSLQNLELQPLQSDDSLGTHDQEFICELMNDEAIENMESIPDSNVMQTWPNDNSVRDTVSYTERRMLEGTDEGPFNQTKPNPYTILTEDSAVSAPVIHSAMETRVQQKLKVNKRGSYTCNKCGKTKKYHICPYDRRSKKIKEPKENKDACSQTPTELCEDGASGTEFVPPVSDENSVGLDSVQGTRDHYVWALMKLDSKIGCTLDRNDDEVEEV